LFEAARKYISTKLNPAQPAIAIAAGNTVSPQNIADFKDAYREIEIVHRCVDIIVGACADIPFVVEADTLRPPTDRVNKVLNKYPNPFEDRIKLFRKAYLDYLLDGNAFFYYDSENNKLYHLPANKISIVPDEKTYIKKFVLNVGSGGFGTAGKPNRTIEYSPEEVIHIKADSSTSEFRGDSKLLNLKRLIELYYSLIEFQKQFFKNNAVPGLVLQTDNVLSKQVKERMLEHWKSVYSTAFQGARSPAILDGGLKVDKLGTPTFTELDFESSVDRVQQDIAKGLGVPYVLLKSGNNANLDANEKVFYNHTVLPIVELFASAFQLFFSTEQSALTVYPDKWNVLVLQPDLKTQALYYSTLVNTGIITPDEGREGLRYKPQGGEMAKIRVPQNITGSATNPSKGGRPS
jgi:HK97 family phage portal protein